MRWPWSKPKPLPIPPYVAPVITPGKYPVITGAKPDPGIVVEEVDTRSMTETGIFKAWKRMTGQS